MLTLNESQYSARYETLEAGFAQYLVGEDLSLKEEKDTIASLQSLKEALERRYPKSYSVILDMLECAVKGHKEKLLNLNTTPFPSMEIYIADRMEDKIEQGRAGIF